MNRLIWCLAVLSLLGLVQTAWAAQPCQPPLGQELRCARCVTVPCVCCDDYCAKPSPCIPCVRVTPSPNCYCPKPMPCIPCLCFTWRSDNYCKKPLPSFCCPCPVKKCP